MTDTLLRPEVRQFLDYLNNLPGPRSHEVEPPEARLMMLKSRQVADAPVGELAIIRNLSCPGPRGEISLRLYDAREQREPGPLVIFFHGGGFVLGDLDTHEPFCAEIARLLDLPVLAVDYRLAPEHPWPAGVEDSIAATRWAASSPEALGREVTGLVPCGDSAGGNFTIIVTLALRDEPAKVPVIAQWPIYPAADPARLYPSQEEYGENYLLSDAGMKWFDTCYRADGESWLHSPMRKDQAGMPPTLILTASHDPIRDQGRAYAAACVEAGVETIYQEAAGTIHGFINLRRAIPSADDDIKGAVAALKFLLARTGR